MVCAAATDDDKDPSEKKEVDDDDESWITRKELFETINSVRIVQSELFLYKIPKILNFQLYN